MKHQRDGASQASSPKQRERFSEAGDPWTQPQPESESEVRRAKFPQFKSACLRRLLTSPDLFPWTEAQFTISQIVGVSSTTADKWIKEISQPYNKNGPLLVAWHNPPRGGRFRVLALAENYLEAQPE